MFFRKETDQVYNIFIPVSFAPDLGRAILIFKNAAQKHMNCHVVSSGISDSGLYYCINIYIKEIIS